MDLSAFRRERTSYDPDGPVTFRHSLIDLHHLLIRARTSGPMRVVSPSPTTTTKQPSSAMRSLKLVLVSLAAFLAIHECKAAKPRQQLLTLNAEVTSADGDPNGSYALLFIDGHLVDSTSTGDDGLTLDLPLGTEAMLEVRKPGFVTKRLVIDTYNISRSQNISCGIMLFPQPQGERMDYTGPVGRISFVPESGEMKVEHDYQLVSQCIDEAPEQLIAVGQ
jgi:hypothetical protein